MGKRYYCDYCDNTFPYNPQNRKKHDEGVQHKTNLQLYYNKFKDPIHILEEESQKKPCYSYLNFGHCQYENICKNSHLSVDQLKELISLARKSNTKVKKCSDLSKSKNSSRYDNKKSVLEDILTRSNDEILEVVNRKKLPFQLQDTKNIPKSLVPLSKNDLFENFI